MGPSIINYFLTCLNQTVPLYTCVDTDGHPMAKYPIDELLGLVSKFYHNMNFRKTTLKFGCSIHIIHNLITRPFDSRIQIVNLNFICKSSCAPMHACQKQRACIHTKLRAHTRTTAYTYS